MAPLAGRPAVLAGGGVAPGGGGEVARLPLWLGAGGVGADGGDRHREGGGEDGELGVGGVHAGLPGSGGRLTVGSMRRGAQRLLSACSIAV